MTLRRIFVAGALALVAFGSGALAQESISSGPQATDIEADQMEVVDAEKKAISRALNSWFTTPT
jgi:hypothetical protein